MTPSIREEVPFKKANDLFASLAVLSETDWGHIDHSIRWAFRGHGDADWLLLPAAWCKDRSKILAPLRGAVETELDRINATDATQREWWVQCGIELRAVEEFCNLADELGYPVPSSGVAEWKGLLPLIRDSGAQTASRIIGHDDSFALAQHHRIPTRLLDWTRRPLVAAFFAAERCVRLKADPTGKHPDYLAIWCFDLSHADGLQNSIDTVTCARHQFSFLHAQDAFFTLDRLGDERFIKSGTWPELDDRIAEEWKSKHWDGKPLRKLTLPSSEANSLLRLLWRHRISTAHLMPTYDNVTTALKMKWSW